MRSREGWALANLFYDKTPELPEAGDLAAWRILLAVQSRRVAAQLKEKLLDLTPPYDPKGSELPGRYQEWAEQVIPAMEEERKAGDARLREQLRSLERISALRVTPLSVPSSRGLEYAQRLAKTAS